MLAELGDLSHPEIARVIGCPPAKVKALVFQARTSADRRPRRPRDAVRRDPRRCSTRARGGVLRRGPLRRHLRQCDPCAAYRVAIEAAAPGLALAAPGRADRRAQGRGSGRRRRSRRRRRHRGGRRRGAVGAGSARGAAGGGSGPAAAGFGAAASGGGGAATAGGFALKALAAKAGVAAAIAATAAGGGVAVQQAVHDPAAGREPAERPVRQAAVRGATVSGTAAPAGARAAVAARGRRARAARQLRRATVRALRARSARRLAARARTREPTGRVRAGWRP